MTPEDVLRLIIRRARRAVIPWFAGGCVGIIAAAGVAGAAYFKKTPDSEYQQSEMLRMALAFGILGVQLFIFGALHRTVIAYQARRGRVVSLRAPGGNGAGFLKSVLACGEVSLPSFIFPLLKTPVEFDIDNATIQTDAWLYINEQPALDENGEAWGIASPSFGGKYRLFVACVPRGQMSPPDNNRTR